MGHIRPPGVHPVLSAAVHHIVASRRDHRPVREPPFQRPALVVAQGVVAQGNRPASGVIQLDPVYELVLVIPQSRDGVRHHLVDDHRAVGYRHAFPVLQMPLLRVGIPGAVPAHVFESRLRQRPALVAGHDGILAAVDQVCVGIVKIYRLPHAAQLEFRVEWPAGVALVRVAAEYDDPPVRLQVHRRKQESDAVPPVAQSHPLQVDGILRRVPDFHPVGIVTVLVRHRGGVAGHNLADHQSAVGAQPLLSAGHLSVLRPHGIGRPPDGLLGGNQHQQHSRRRQNDQCNHVPPGASAPHPGGAGSRPASRSRLILHSASPLSSSVVCSVYPIYVFSASEHLVIRRCFHHKVTIHGASGQNERNRFHVYSRRYEKQVDFILVPCYDPADVYHCSRHSRLKSKAHKEDAPIWTEVSEETDSCIIEKHGLAGTESCSGEGTG